MRAEKLLCLITTVALVAPVQLSAQACLGIPAANGQFAFQAGIGLTSEAISYGGSFTANFHGPLSAGVGYTYTDFDDYEEGGYYEATDGPNGNTVSANLAFEITGIGFSACPILGLEYSDVTDVLVPSWMRNDVTVKSLAVPVGVGVGKTLPVAGDWLLTPFGSGQVLFVRSEARAGDVHESTDDSTEFGGALGFLFGSERIQIAGAGSITTIGDSDPTFKLGLSLVF